MDWFISTFSNKTYVHTRQKALKEIKEQAKEIFKQNPGLNEIKITNSRSVLQGKYCVCNGINENKRFLFMYTCEENGNFDDIEFRKKDIEIWE